MRALSALQAALRDLERCRAEFGAAGVDVADAEVSRLGLALGTEALTARMDAERSRVTQLRSKAKVPPPAPKAAADAPLTKQTGKHPSSLRS